MGIPDTISLLLMGHVGKPHGLQGTCKVIPETDDPQRFALLQRVYIGSSPEQVHGYEIEQARMQYTRRGTVVLLTLAGVDTPEKASALSRLSLFARETDLPALAEDEFFLHDIVGLDVWTDKGQQVGSVRDVWEMPASNVYVVERPDGEDLLIPAVPAFIEHIDQDGSRLVVRPIDGLLD